LVPVARWSSRSQSSKERVGAKPFSSTGLPRKMNRMWSRNGIDLAVLHCTKNNPLWMAGKAAK
jgi:hypothetical protein